MVVVAQAEDMPGIVLKCIAAGKNVFAEKPLGLTSAEAKELSDKAHEAGVILIVGFMKRYAPSYLKLKEMVTSKQLGEAKSFNVEFAVDSTPFCKDEEAFLKLAAIHIVDLMRYLFGEAVAVSGFKSLEGGNISQAISLKFDSGVVGNAYLVGMDAWTRERENITVTFENGFATVEDINKVIIHRSSHTGDVSWQTQTEEDTVLTPSATPMSGAHRDLYLRGFVGELTHFKEHCINGETPMSSGEDNIKTMDLVESILMNLK
ncbi:MAG: Gfo/Idh/MocA family oxidoreductase [Alkalibacterium sp.]|nr:Gfo/Idh/MocA family oxidoreductase [Alkalibacterium sp.]